jgi:hypothetical protein
VNCAELSFWSVVCREMISTTKNECTRQFVSRTLRTLWIRQKAFDYESVFFESTPKVMARIGYGEVGPCRVWFLSVTGWMGIEDNRGRRVLYTIYIP